ncbi:sigma-54 dependent transcriptional regulator [Emticicia sp. BO119]|uniref:sigma-54-dependent transcriptional regulator n=1 Tax=Emticicia sp. BO119 TaxID=2757768 RepID=UPI0015F0E6BB|nr:sigma-54 dependent transcriptional regulator [Emticicia sp. BO119]MBA4851393.1 sigma-54-dependent Fis family transcriptional regulator [Emticicia sp. BO119]
MLLIIDDDIAVRTSLSLLMKKEGFDFVAVGSQQEALAFLQLEVPDLVILDMNFSNDTSGDDGLNLLEKIKKVNNSIPVILITGWATIDLAVKGMKLGASDFINKPWQNAHLMQSIRTILDLSEKKTLTLTRKRLDAQYNFSQLIGEDAEFLRILETIGRVASTDASVLIMGESGTGKELIAEAIHQNSQRNRKPFVKVNLGGISTSLFESEMFGHVRGAFTDARYDRVGRFEMANKGTIFLDEIGDLDLSSQVKLLRVLQDRTYEVLGSSRTKTLDVRVVCATNKNLEESVQKNAFREDLLYRINLITINLPPLRKRPNDIPLLVNFFVQNLREIYSRPNLRVTQEAMKWLKQLPLPGNIRQLKNLVERTILVSSHDTLEVADFQAQWQPTARKPSSVALPEVGSMTLEEMEVQMIKRALEFHKGKVMTVAKALGLTRSALYRRLEKYNIPHDEDPD